MAEIATQVGTHIYRDAGTMLLMEVPQYCYFPSEQQKTRDFQATARMSLVDRVCRIPLADWMTAPALGLGDTK